MRCARGAKNAAAQKTRPAGGDRAAAATPAHRVELCSMKFSDRLDNRARPTGDRNRRWWR